MKTSYSNAGDLLPEGEYECRIMKAEYTTTKKGTPYINVDCVIRDDVDGQKYGNKHQWDSLFKNKETGEFNMRRINSICYGIGLPEGTELPDGDLFPDAFCNLIVLKYVRIVVKHMDDEYKGEKVARIHYYKPSAINKNTFDEINPDGFKDLPDDDEELSW